MFCTNDLVYVLTKGLCSIFLQWLIKAAYTMFARFDQRIDQRRVSYERKGPDFHFYSVEIGIHRSSGRLLKA